MHSDYQPHEPIRARLERDRRAIDALLADPATDDLVLERLPNGEHAWLRPAPTDQLARYSLNPARVVIADTDEDPRYVLTDQGRRDLAMAHLFDRGPTVADVVASRTAHCSACGQGQDTPDCASREHWGAA